MAAEVIAAWIAAAASLGSAAVSWAAQRGASRAAASADRQTAIVTAKTDVWTSDKSVFVEHVTAERGVWRSELRHETATIVAWLNGGRNCVDAQVLHYALSGVILRLNPKGFSGDAIERDSHPLDRDIHAVVKDIRSSMNKPTTYSDLATRLEVSVALLLKQEWQVSKDEAKRTVFNTSHVTSNSPAAPIPPAVHIDTTT